MNQRVLRAMDAELIAAAVERWVVPGEDFLWRARRCAEAMLYALLVEARVDVIQFAAPSKGLDHLAKQPKLQGLIPHAMRDHLESVQKYGNTATYFQPEGPVSEASATASNGQLAPLNRFARTPASNGRLAPQNCYARTTKGPQRLAPPLNGCLLAIGLSRWPKQSGHTHSE